MLNQGRPLLRAEQSGARKGKGSRVEISACPEGDEGSGKVQRRDLSDMGSFFDGGCAGPGRGLICDGE